MAHDAQMRQRQQSENDIFRLTLSGSSFFQHDVEVTAFAETVKGWVDLIEFGNLIWAKGRFNVSHDQLRRARQDVYIRSVAPGSVVIEIVRYIGDNAVGGVIEGIAAAAAFDVYRRRSEYVRFLKQIINEYIEKRSKAESFEDVLDKMHDFLRQAGQGMIDPHEGIESVRVFDSALNSGAAALHEEDDVVSVAYVCSDDVEPIELDYSSKRVLSRSLPDKVIGERESINAMVLFKRLHVDTGNAIVEVIHPRSVESSTRSARVSDMRLEEARNPYAMSLAMRKPIWVQMILTQDDEHQNPWWDIRGLGVERQGKLFGDVDIESSK